jgi:TolA-binding protein
MDRVSSPNSADVPTSPSNESRETPPASASASEKTGDETPPSQTDEKTYEDTFRKAVQKYVQGKFEEARTLFEECRKQRPDDPRPKKHLAHLDALDE